MTIQLFANSYDISAKGFSFTSNDEFRELYKKHLPTEEYEIEYIDGDDAAQKIFEEMRCHQGNIARYFEILDAICNNELLQAAIFVLLENNIIGADDVLEKAEDECHVFEGTLKEYAYNLVDECYFDKNTPEIFKNYFDYDAFIRDLEIEGRYYECTIDGTDYVVEVD